MRVDLSRGNSGSVRPCFHYPGATVYWLAASTLTLPTTLLHNSVACDLILRYSVLRRGQRVARRHRAAVEIAAVVEGERQ